MSSLSRRGDDRGISDLKPRSRYIKVRMAAWVGELTGTKQHTRHVLVVIKAFIFQVLSSICLLHSIRNPSTLQTDQLRILTGGTRDFHATPKPGLLTSLTSISSLGFVTPDGRLAASSHAKPGGSNVNWTRYYFPKTPLA
jgi:hypothetical protein